MKQMLQTPLVKQSVKEEGIDGGHLSIRSAKKVEGEYFKKLLADVQELLKDVKTSFSEDIIGERNT